MVQCHCNEPTDELEVVEVIGVHVGRRIDLQAVVVLVGILEQAVHRVQHLVGQQEKPFPVTVNGNGNQRISRIFQ